MRGHSSHFFILRQGNISIILDTDLNQNLKNLSIIDLKAKQKGDKKC